MRKWAGRVALVLTYIGILGLPEDLNRWERLAKAVDWYYWLNSGEWWPWSIRAVLLAVLFILAFNPEFNIRLRNKLNPRWPNGTPMGWGYIWGWKKEAWKEKFLKRRF